METTEQKALRDFVTLKHGSQKRKYTGEPYVNHCFEVGIMAQSYCVDFGFEIGLCHDLIEDTECTLPELLDFLLNVGYNRKDSLFITSCVNDLTDVFITEDYPKLNRKKRKQLEAERLGKTNFVSQSVKYCDLINNTESICENDPKFAKVYLQEKREILKLMCGGNILLLSKCLTQIYKRTQYDL